MNKVKSIFLLLFLSIGTIASYAEELVCDVNSTQLSIYKKADFRVVSAVCHNDNPYILNYLVNDKQKIFINKYSLDVGKWIPKLEAVSVYKKLGKSPLLITIHTQYWDTPTISGISYDINLYEILNKDGEIKLIDITEKLGGNQSGLDGESDQKMTFKLKDIASIKKWLDKNYK
ncbi:hypothetical protein [Acinetobacter rudis]|uniref:Uncharacterized protein n=1 Tax=Acinetobacter rudis CIP 110305 TaxID=421052 RepID=S3N9E0_9GAMM|nr:hypothetical protein [Acinetobacter rudis]EPF70954.1 hypothetical protein F945_02717 [Acinetobacter rudis CIP 110305]